MKKEELEREVNYLHQIIGSIETMLLCDLPAKPILEFINKHKDGKLK